jgi:glycosyltransferase involved in cell wall biosynthesis
VPSRSAETFGLAAAEAMAAGVPVVASAAGALPELVGGDGLVAPGDVDALAAAARARFGDEDAGQAGLERVLALAGPAVVAGLLRPLY